jgi:hypothetical protein
MRRTRACAVSPVRFQFETAENERVTHNPLSSRSVSESTIKNILHIFNSVFETKYNIIFGKYIPDAGRCQMSIRFAIGLRGKFFLGMRLQIRKETYNFE